MMANSPDKPLDSPEDSQSWMDWRKQLQAYVAWVNSQLKKKPGARLVEDLRRDMKDGVALVHLIEIVGKERLSGVHSVPANTSEMRENVDRVLHFMSTNRIRMHHIAAKDIVEGNLKAIMRLILALAAHFKPDSVKHSTHYPRSPSKGNVTGIAQGAAAAIADARRNAARAGNRVRRNRDAVFNERRCLESSSDPCSDSDQSYGRSSGTCSLQDRGQLEGASNNSSPSSSKRPSPRMTASMSSCLTSCMSSSLFKDKSGQLQRSKSTDCISSKDSGAELEDYSLIDKTQYDELLLEYDEMAEAMRETKKHLILLQDLLLSGQPPDGEEQMEEVFEGSTPSEQMVVLKSRLQQSTEVCNDLKDALSKTRNECRELQGAKAGLTQRLAEQDVALSQLKGELLHKDFDKQNLEAENAELRKTIQQKEKALQDLRRDLGKRDQHIDRLQGELQVALREKEKATQALKSQVMEIHQQLCQVGETGASLHAQVMTQDRRMAQLQDRLYSSSSSSENGRDSQPPTRSCPQPHRQILPHTQKSADDLDIVRECLQSLRRHFQPSDPQHHTIDSLEQSIAYLVEKLYTCGMSPSQSLTQVTFDAALMTPKHTGYDSTDFSHPKLDNSSRNGQPFTRVLYFTDKAVTPFMCTIHKRLGEIRLRDFKELFEHHGQYRFHFKALDPEYGTVKEEVCNDEDIIPGWEGKIVAWIEEDCCQNTAV